MLFALFFGAGNLIFPPMLGQMAGENVWTANAGFLVTGVGLPLLAITAFVFQEKMICSLWPVVCIRCSALYLQRFSI